MADRPPVTCPVCGISVPVPEGYMVVFCTNNHRIELTREGLVKQPPPNEPNWIQLHADLKALRSYAGWLLAIVCIVIASDVIYSLVLLSHLKDVACSLDPSCVPGT